MSVHSGSFPRVDPGVLSAAAWLGARWRAILAAVRRPLASAEAWVEARRRRRAVRRAAWEEERRMEWWRSQ